MSFRRVTLAVVMTLALLLPAVVMAQAPNPFGNAYTLWASLRGDNEIPPGDPDGLGFAKITIDLDSNQVCFQLSVANIDTPTASHIHRGAAGVNGPIVVPLAAPVDGFARGCADIDPVLATEILNNPAGFYVNVHTGAYPPGAVRGQLATLGGVPISVPMAEPPTIETVVSGLNSPRGIDVADDGTIYFAQAGVGGDECVTLTVEEEEREVCFGGSGSISMVEDGEAVDIMTGIPSFLFAENEYVGAQDVIVDGDDVLGVVGLGMDPALREQAGEPAEGLGTVIIATGDGGWEVVEDVSAYEAANNPDGNLFDSNPFSAFVTETGGIVSDAGANAVISFPFDGEASTLAVFPDTMVDAPPFLELPPGTQIPMQAVPTGTVLGPDGAIYVGQLTGFPFVEGAAKVYRIVPGEEPTVYAEGFTNIIDLAFDDDGNLWVLEIAAGSLINVDPENPASMAGGLYRVTPDGTVSAQLSEGLVFPSGMAFGPDGTLYISNYGLMPGMGEIISVTWND